MFEKFAKIWQTRKPFVKGKPPTCHSPSQLVHPEGGSTPYTLAGSSNPRWSWLVHPTLAGPSGGGGTLAGPSRGGFQFIMGRSHGTSQVHSGKDTWVHPEGGTLAGPSRGGYPGWSIQPWLVHPEGVPNASWEGHMGPPQCILGRSHGTPPPSLTD